MSKGDDNGDDNRVLAVIEMRPDITAKDMSQVLGISARKISRIIKQLRESGRITRIGSDRKGYWKIN